MPRACWLAVGAAAAALIAAGGFGGLPILAVTGGSLVLLAAASRRGVSPQAQARIVAPLAFAVAGGVAVLLRAGFAGGPSPSATVPEGAGPWTASVASVGSPRAGQQTALIRFEIAGEPLVAATLPRYPEIQPGDRVKVAGALRAPGDDGYGQYLARIGAIATLRARTMEALEPATDPAWAVERLRRTAGEAIEQAIPEPAAGLAAGILVGLRDRVDRELAADFTTAGVSHVVAISGWNIAIVAGLVAALLRGVSRRRRAALTIVVIGAYVAFAGASPSVLRAAVMAGVVLLARESGRAGRAAAVLGLAATLLLLADPRLILDAGFQLSTLATAGLIAWATPLAERLAGPSPGRVRRWLADSLGISLAAQAATLPIVLASFGRLSLIAPAVNLFVVPLVPLAMAAGVVGMLVGWAALVGLPAGVAVVAGLPAWAVLGAIIAIVRAGAGLPIASVGIEPPWSVIAGAVAAIAIVAVSRRWANRAKSGADPSGSGAGSQRRSAVAREPQGPRWAPLVGVGLAGAFVSLALAVSYQPDGSTRITVLDVGQGDAILVEGARGGRILLDSGPSPDALIVALDERLPPWDRRLDALILTHPHEDHVAGAALLVERYRIGRVFEPGMRGPGPGAAAAREQIAARGVQHGTLATGDRIAVDDVAFTVLWPDPGRVPSAPADTGTGINNVSIVLLGEVGGRRILLTGDIEEAIDPILLARGLPRLDFLKVAHHGSRTATTDRFLDATRPALAVISAGTGNPYGHPAPATLARLTARDARVLRTDQAGTVEVAVDGAGRLTARAERTTSSAARTLAPPKPVIAAATRIATQATTTWPASQPFACSVPQPLLANAAG